MGLRAALSDPHRTTTMLALQSERSVIIVDCGGDVIQRLMAASIPLTDIAYVGNDVNDLGALGIVGWPIAVANAHPQVKAAARVVLTKRGGEGAVREVIEQMLPR